MFALTDLRRGRRKPRLSSDVLLRTLAFTILSALVTGIVLGTVLFTRYQQDRFDIHRELTRSAAQTVEMFFEQPRLLLTELGFQIDAATDPVAFLQQQGPGFVQRSEHTDALVLLDNDRLVRAAIPEARFPLGFDMSGFSELGLPFTRGNMRLSLVGVIGDRGNPQLFIARRINSGVLIGYFNMRELSSMLRAIPVSEHAGIALIDERGVYAMHSDFSKVQRQEYEPLHQRLFAENGFVSDQLVIDRRDHKILAGAYPVLDNQWLVLTYHELTPLTAGLQQAALYSATALLLIALLMGVWIFYSMKAVVQPLAAVTQRLHNMAAGDYTGRIEYNGFREIEVIASSFNAMADSIQKFQTRITSEVHERRQAEAVLQELVNEKDVLLQELHHRVKNNLQIMSSLLNLQLMRVSNESTRNLLQGVRLKLISLSMVHEQLYLSTSMSKIDLSEFLRDIVTVIQQELKPNELKLTFLLQLDQVYLQVDKATTASILLNELLANEVLHAYPTGGDGTISITLKQQGSTVRIHIQDSGVGFPATTDPEQPTSLGLTLVQALTSQLQGQVTFQTDQKGLSVNLEFPLELQV